MMMTHAKRLIAIAQGAGMAFAIGCGNPANPQGDGSSTDSGSSADVHGGTDATMLDVARNDVQGGRDTMNGTDGTTGRDATMSDVPVGSDVQMQPDVPPPPPGSVAVTQFGYDLARDLANRSETT